MNIENELKNIIKNSLDLEIDIDEITIEVPSVKEHGDFSTNIAMKLSKKMNKKPFEIAEIIKSSINSSLIDKIEIAGPGFINFFVKKDYLLENIKTIIKQGSDYGKSNIGNKEKINVEFVSVNPTGIIHLGHARGACFGDSLCNILDFAGYDTTREYYINDSGNQVYNMSLSIKERYKQLCGLDYEMKEEYYKGQEITDVAKILYDQKQDGYLDADLEVFKKIGLEVFLNKIKEDLEEIRVKFNIWTSEQKLRDDGLVEKGIEKLKELNYTYELDGATWLKTSEFGDEKDRVIVKQNGFLTYLVPDIAYHLDKINRGYDKLIDIFGADHHGYVARLKASVSMLGGDSEKLNVYLVQMVRAIKDGSEYKLQKRTGKTITLKDLVETTGVDPIRYFFIARSLDSQMDFDIDLATSKSNENPVYYIQYAHARICSILKDYKDINIEDDYKFETINSEAAYNVLSKLNEFTKTVQRSALKREPHLITNYVYDLASLFHSYYTNEKIITEDEKYTKERIMLIKSVKITIANALKLIGVSSPERM